MTQLSNIRYFKKIKGNYRYGWEHYTIFNEVFSGVLVIVFVFLMCFKNIFYMKKILNNFLKIFFMIIMCWY